MRNGVKDEIRMGAIREDMLEQGFRLFSERDIESVTMQEVSDACGVGIATLYRYFNTKMDLVIAIAVRKWEEYDEFTTAMRKERIVEKMTAAEELEFYLDFYIDLYRNHGDLLRFNQNFNSYARHEGATKEELEPYVRAVSNLVRFFHGLYEKGKTDGTIRTHMPESKMFASTAHIMLAVAVRYAQGLLYDGDNEEDRTEEFNLLKKMILREFVSWSQ